MKAVGQLVQLNINYMYRRAGAHTRGERYSDSLVPVVHVLQLPGNTANILANLGNPASCTSCPVVHQEATDV